MEAENSLGPEQLVLGGSIQGMQGNALRRVTSRLNDVIAKRGHVAVCRFWNERLIPSVPGPVENGLGSFAAAPGGRCNAMFTSKHNG